MIEEIAAEVRQHLLLSSMSDQAFAELISHCRIVHLGHNESLFHQGSEAHSFYIVLSGRVKLFRVSPDGQTKVIEVVSPGQAFAEALMFLDQHKYPLNAEGMEPGDVLLIPRQYYMKLLMAEPECAVRLLGSMALKLHRRINEIETLTLQNTRHRLGHYLSNLAPDQTAQSCCFDLPMAKQLIASQLGMQPETFSRLIKEMKSAGIISVHGAEISVHDLSRLRAFGH